MAAATSLWSIDELGEEVVRALSMGYAGSESGRIRALPDRRTIRYYNTLGLLDRPAKMRGRTALYGRIHLLQIVAIKKLQASGHSLAEIQSMLAGASRQRLEAIAEVPESVAQEAAPSSAGPRERSRRDLAFWQRRPSGAQQPPSSRDLESRDPVRELEQFVGLELAPGVNLLLRAAAPLSDADAAAVRAAATELIATLGDRGLL